MYMLVLVWEERELMVMQANEIGYTCSNLTSNQHWLENWVRVDFVSEEINSSIIGELEKAHLKRLDSEVQGEAKWQHYILLLW